MATANSSRSARARARPGGNQPRTHPPVAPPSQGMPSATQQLLLRETRRLHKALAVLACMQVAADYDEEVDFGDVTAVVRDLIDKALYELDLAGLGSRADKKDG